MTRNFDNILNFRDVGRSINNLVHFEKIHQGLLFRSARPDDATASDRQLISFTYNIRTIVDLRSKTELINAAKKHSDAFTIAQSALVPSSNAEIITPLKIQDIHYFEINLNGKAFERTLLWKLSWSSLARLLTLMALGYRTEAISILGKEVMQPRGLVGLGIDTLDFSGSEIREVLDVLADEQNYPLLLHCTQGKDRTGLIVLIITMLCGVDLQAIQQDYMASEKELEPERAERLTEIVSIGLDESFTGCPAEFVQKLVEHIELKYGGIQPYLMSIGVALETQKKIQATLCATW